MALNRSGWASGLLVVLTAVLIAPHGAAAQQVLSQPERTIQVARGQSALLTRPSVIERISIADPDIADAQPLSPTEILITARQVGTTSLFIWAEGDVVRLYNVEVAPDVAALERQLEALFPDEDLFVTTAGNTLILSGTVRDPAVVRRALELANTTGAQVVNNIQAPSPEQILLEVEFAEVDRSAVREFGGSLIRVLNPDDLDEAFGEDDDLIIETLSQGLVNFTVLGDNAALDAMIRALKSTGNFTSLARPNLVAVEGQEATFLAGGEFPFPSVQGGGAAGAVGIQFQEFGIQLTFTPTITNTGSIHLRVAPEVSSLDFANGLIISGFQIPSILSRRVETEVELRPGQHLAIGGLMDNSISETIDKIPLLGDIPILGAFFRSTARRQNRTELLVLVTPHIVQPLDEKPPLPGGDPAEWDWDRTLRDMGTGRPAGGPAGG